MPQGEQPGTRSRTSPHTAPSLPHLAVANTPPSSNANIVKTGVSSPNRVSHNNTAYSSGYQSYDEPTPRVEEQDLAIVDTLDDDDDDHDDDDDDDLLENYGHTPPHPAQEQGGIGRDPSVSLLVPTQVPGGAQWSTASHHELPDTTPPTRSKSRLGPALRGAAEGVDTTSASRPPRHPQHSIDTMSDGGGGGGYELGASVPSGSVERAPSRLGPAVRAPTPAGTAHMFASTDTAIDTLYTTEGGPPRPPPSSIRKLARALDGTMAGVFDRYSSSPVLNLIINSLARGIGQVVFMTNPVTGLVILIALLVQDWITGLYGILALLSSTLAAHGLGIENSAISSGLFGFNGILCGLALPTFAWAPGTTPSSHQAIFVLIATIITGALSTVFMVSVGNLLSRWNVPAFTTPFNLATFIMVIGASQGQYSNLTFASINVGALGGVGPFDQGDELVKGIFRGIGQVFFMDKWYCGLITWLGIAICSRISALFALLGSMVGMATAIYLGADQHAVYAGLWGYNSVLGTMAIGGLFYVLSLRVAVLALSCGMVSALVFGALKVFLASTVQVPAFTLPFCLATLPFVLMQGNIGQHWQAPDLSEVETPEALLLKRKIQQQQQQRQQQPNARSFSENHELLPV